MGLHGLESIESMSSPLFLHCDVLAAQPFDSFTDKSVTLIASCDNSMTAKIFHPLLALIASASNNELAKYVEFLKEENKILRARVPGQVHTKPDERSRLVKLGKALGQGIEELITLVSPSTFYRWCREELSRKSVISLVVSCSALREEGPLRRISRRNSFVFFRRETRRLRPTAGILPTFPNEQLAGDRGRVANSQIG